MGKTLLPLGRKAIYPFILSLFHYFIHKVMKKSLLLLSLLVLLASCADDGLLPQPSDTIKSVTITASDIILDEPTTRTDLTLGNGLEFTWAESDVVGIFPNTGDQLSFPMTEGAGTQSAHFDGGGWAVKGSSDYAAYFPFSKDNYGKSRTALPFCYDGQTLSANGSTAGLGDYDYMVATASSPSDGNISFSFEHINSFLWLQLTSPVAAQFTELTLGNENNGGFTCDATIDISTGVITKKSASYMRLDLQSISVEAGERLDAWMVVAPVDLLGDMLTVSLTTTDGDVYETKIAGKTFLAGHGHTLKGTLAYKHTIPNPRTELSYVDLGLPSGTLWATTNIGAYTSPSYPGDSYAWGETKEKQTYAWDSYKWCKGTDNTFTKYCTNDLFGTVDGKTTLQLEDDAAHVRLGGNWRMPTKAEMDELKTECTWTWTTEGGRTCCQVVGPNGNSIYLPAGGTEYDEEGLVGYGELGLYWTSTLYTQFSLSGYAYCLYFDDSGIGTLDFSLRYFGGKVRPVYDATPKPEYVDLGLSVKWATYNVGASKPEEYGNYYAWGETESKTTYVWDSYKWCASSGTDLTKYCREASYGTIDNRNALDWVDDVANAEWGTNWRMPTYGELDELRARCDWTWVTLNGVKGFEVTGPNGNSIFLPAAGYKSGSYQYSAGTLGRYWGRNIHHDAKSDKARYLYFAEGNRKEYDFERCYGLSVRPVYDERPKHDYVDLGLSVKWATCNVGARYPEDYGEYYAWGETEPKGKYDSDWTSYKWCNGTENYMTKYCSSSSFGIVDGRSVLDLSDDVASLKWGGSWRMPTKEEQAELADKCVWTWMTQNGVDGFVVTALNGNSIFLPAAGYMEDISPIRVGEEGNYWSSTSSNSNNSEASEIYFTSVSTNLPTDYRYIGFSVRPVCTE